LVDAIPPESDAAREFREAVDRGDVDYVRARLTEWRRNVGTVLPMLQSNAALAEIVDVANAVSDLCSIGLAALDGKADGSRIAEDSKARAEMVIQIAPGIQKLVDGQNPAR
jgi:hypothetical protein